MQQPQRDQTRRAVHGSVHRRGGLFGNQIKHSVPVENVVSVIRWHKRTRSETSECGYYFDWRERIVVGSREIDWFHRALWAETAYPPTAPEHL